MLLELSMANFFVYSLHFVFPGWLYGLLQRFGPDSIPAALNVVNILSTQHNKSMLLAKFGFVGTA